MAGDLQDDDRAEDPDHLERKHLAGISLMPGREGSRDVGEPVQVLPRARSHPAHDRVEAGDVQLLFLLLCAMR